ncbi:DUF4139 domain-containing protein [Tateyamaria sp. SN3-11]|uniref:DUF4139 domain-containing protein n=1 Tax=Tateyamaria sp. SN3-11 TaxID=3092147 RepID=UPI0039ED43F6
MRFALLIALLPFPALADTFTVTAPPLAVTAYAEGAIVTRGGTVGLSAGTHTLHLTDMDPEIDADAIDISVTGASILSRTWNERPDTPYRAPRTPAYIAAKDALDAAVEALAARDDAIALALAKAQAAQDQIGFLNGITLPDDAATDVDTLRAIGQLIASDGTAARGAMRAAEAEARALRQGRDDLEFAVAEAQAALDAVTPSNTQPATLSVDVNVPEATTADVTVRYFSDAVSWRPLYTMHLENDDTLRIERAVMIDQFSNEDWTDVRLSLSTLQPSGQTSPSRLPALRRRIEDPAETMRLRGSATMDMAAPAEVMLESPVIVEEVAAAADFDGIGVTYTLPAPVSVPAGGERIRVALDTLRFDAALSARATPRFDDTAFRQVRFENTSPEILLPGETILYVEDQLVGGSSLDALPPNAEADIFFGAIDGLRIKRTVLNRNEGDRGIITRSNEETQAVRIEVENLTDRTWEVALRDAVPFSEQEDLVIEWSATPAPDIDAVDDRRGILEWQLELDAGATQSIALETRMTWPEDMILR